MKLHELFEQFDNFDLIKDKFLELYPDQKDNIIGHEAAFYEIKNISKKSYLPNEDNMSIYVKQTEDDFGSEEEKETYVHVSGYVPNDEECVWWAIEFKPWAEWLNYPIWEESFKEFSKEELICHILWKMTFNGYTEEQVNEKREELDASVKEIDDAIENGTIDQITIPAEEFFKQIEEMGKKDE